MLSPTSSPSSALVEACAALDEAIRSGSLSYSDVGTRSKYIGNISKALDVLERPPRFEPSSPAQRIAALLWFENRPGLNPDAVKRIKESLSDSDPHVRLTAVLSIDRQLQETPNPFDEDTLLEIHSKLKRQSEREEIPFIQRLLERQAFRVQGIVMENAKSRRTLQNPYIAGSPIVDKGMFFGRKDVLKWIEQDLNQSGVRTIVLHGARRTGKTSLLFQIVNGVLGEGFLPVYLDMQNVAGESADQFCSYMLDALHGALANADLSAASTTEASQGSTDITGTIRQALASISGRTLLLLIDEYELLQDYFKSGELTSKFRSLIDNEPNLCLIFAGATKVENLEEKNLVGVLETARYRKISFLEEREATQLITQPPGEQLAYSQQAVDKIWKLTRGHPFYIQVLCQSLFYRVDGEGRVDEEDVEAVTKDFIANPPPHLILTWKDLDFESRVVTAVLAAIASPERQRASPQDIRSYLKSEKSRVQLSLSEITRVLSHLDKDLDLVETEDRKRYAFTMDLVRRWIAGTWSIWDVFHKQKKQVMERAAPGKVLVRARFLDYVAMIVILGLLAWVFYRFENVDQFLVLVPLFTGIYSIALNIAIGRTLGEALIGIRPKTLSGLNPNWPRRALRGIGQVGQFTVAIFFLWVAVASIIFRSLTSGLYSLSVLPRWAIIVVLGVVAAGVIDVMALVLGPDNRTFGDAIGRVVMVRDTA